jgi:hypothetical protein
MANTARAGIRHWSRSPIPTKSSSATLAIQIRNTSVIARAGFRTVTDAATPIPTYAASSATHTARARAKKAQGIAWPCRAAKAASKPITIASGTTSAARRTAVTPARNEPRPIGWERNSSSEPSSRARFTAWTVASSASSGSSSTSAWQSENSTRPMPVKPSTLDSRIPTRTNAPASSP